MFWLNAEALTSPATEAQLANAFVNGAIDDRSYAKDCLDDAVGMGVRRNTCGKLLSTRRLETGGIHERVSYHLYIPPFRP
jgi:hypothetical protein